MKGQAKQSREVVRARSEMLELGEGDMMEELDQELTGGVSLVRRESFDGDENGGGSDDEDKEGVDARWGKGMDWDGDRVGRGHVGRFVSWSGREIWHSYRGGLEWR